MVSITRMDNTKNNGLCTSAWGSPGWFFLHCVAAGYPVDPDEYDDIRGNIRGHTRRAYTSFFKNTGHVLPCRFCRESYIVFIDETPIEDFVHSREKLFEWLFIIHNKVNEKLGHRQENKLKLVVDKYERFRAACNNDRKGCTEPASQNEKRLRCRLVVEPIDNKKKNRIMLSCYIVATSVVVMLIYRLTLALSSRRFIP